MTTHRQKTSGEQGFSLIELAVLLIIAGLLVAGVMHYLRVKTAQQKIHATSSAVFSITDGLSRFLSENGFYPCPARRDAGQGGANYGIAGNCADTSVPVGSCANGYCVVASPSVPGARIRVGVIPGRTLNLGMEDILDAQNNQFTYAVTETQATPAYAEGNGAIRLLNAQRVVGPGNVVSYTPFIENVDIVFFSHGDDQAGAFNAAGNSTGIACTGARTDVENCDGDGTFTSQYYAMSPAATGPYDDRFVSNIWSWVYIWDKTMSSDKNIYNRDWGNLGIGTGPTITPTQKLHVYQGNMRVDGNLQSAAICAEDGNACFPAELLGGSGMHCDPTSEFMAGLQNNNVLCRNALNNSIGGCVGSSFISGVTLSASGINLADCTDYFSGGSTTTTIIVGALGEGDPGSGGTGTSTSTTRPTCAAWEVWSKLVAACVPK